MKSPPETTNATGRTPPPRRQRCFETCDRFKHTMFPPGSYTQDPDAAIRLTDTDAAQAKLSAVTLGYFDDRFVRYFVPRAHLVQPRPPLINIGTYIRTVAIDELVGHWLTLAGAAGKRAQVVSLGAGSDTRFWKLATGPCKEHLSRYIELDFPEVTMKKVKSIVKTKDLTSVLGGHRITHGGTGLSSEKYIILPGDLRQNPEMTFQPLSSSSPPTSQQLLDPNLPTLLLFECVLVYMTPEASSSILQWFLNQFNNDKGLLGSIVYEMYGLEDSFGRVMKSNLKARKIDLPGAEPYTTKESLLSRYLGVGFSHAEAVSLKDIRVAWAAKDPAEWERISHLQMLDEIEELDLVLDHYAITWGTSRSVADSEWQKWGLKLSDS